MDFEQALALWTIDDTPIEDMALWGVKMRDRHGTAIDIMIDHWKKYVRAETKENMLALTNHIYSQDLGDYTEPAAGMKKQQTFQALYNILKEKDITSIADLGSGDGRLAIALATQLNATVYAFEISDAGIAATQRRTPQKYEELIIPIHAGYDLPTSRIRVDVAIMAFPVMCEHAFMFGPNFASELYLCLDTHGFPKDYVEHDLALKAWNVKDLRILDTREYATDREIAIVHVMF
jgi:SAM-dependent methyltransferase